MLTTSLPNLDPMPIPFKKHFHHNPQPTNEPTFCLSPVGVHGAPLTSDQIDILVSWIRAARDDGNILQQGMAGIHGTKTCYIFTYKKLPFKNQP